MKRRLLNFAAAVSLFLCAATLLVWCRSNYVEDSACYGFGPSKTSPLKYTQIGGGSHGGEVFLYYAHSENNRSASGLVYGFYPQSDAVDLYSDPRIIVRQNGFEWSGFGYYSRSYSPGGRYRQAIAPHWGIALFFAILPVARLLSWRYTRRPPGTCVNCGYDLRATPNRCPECGKVAANIIASLPVAR